jgi:hypothetical protein
MKAMARQRSHSIAFKRQVAQEFIAGETLYGLSKRHMSALHPKADIAQRDCHVRFVPEADSCTAAILSWKSARRESQSADLRFTAAQCQQRG